jgi:hypothetical protein
MQTEDAAVILGEHGGCTREDDPEVIAEVFANVIAKVIAKVIGR